MSEQEEQSQALVIPGTGVVVNLENEREVAIAYRDLKEVRDELTRIDRVLREAFGDRKRLIGTGTFYIEGVGKVEVSKDKEVVWDELGLIEGLKDAGMPEESIKEIVKEKSVVTYTVDARRANAAARANEKYAEVIERCKITQPRTPSISIT